MFPPSYFAPRYFAPRYWPTGFLVVIIGEPAAALTAFPGVATFVVSPGAVTFCPLEPPATFVVQCEPDEEGP